MNKRINENKKILVLGAGIVGAAVSYYLSKAGYEVTVVEKDGPCAGASGACNGGISYFGKTGTTLDWAVESLKIYQNLSKELGSQVEIDQSRDVILLGKDEEDERLLETLVLAAHEKGLPAEILRGASLKNYLPNLTDDVRLAAVTPGGLQGIVSPFSVAYAYLDAAKVLGASYLQAEVKELYMESGQMKGVVAAGQVIKADAVVNCLGFAADKVWKNQGIDFKIVPVKGVVLVSEPYPKLFPGNLLNADFMKKNPPEVSLAVEQTMDGNLLIGACKLRGEDTIEIPADMPGRIVRNAMTYVEGLEGLSIIRSFSGIRPQRDAGAFIGRTSLEGVYGAVGFGGSGITLAPYAGARIAEIIKEEI
jgi:sarcosine oxidase subunit beta